MTSPQLLRAALVFYGAMAVSALVWGQLGSNATLLWWPGRTTWPLAAVGLLAGSLVGLLSVGLSRLLMRFRWKLMILLRLASPDAVPPEAVSASSGAGSCTAAVVSLMSDEYPARPLIRPLGNICRAFG